MISMVAAEQFRWPTKPVAMLARSFWWHATRPAATVRQFWRLAQWAATVAKQFRWPATGLVLVTWQLWWPSAGPVAAALHSRRSMTFRSCRLWPRQLGGWPACMARRGRTRCLDILRRSRRPTHPRRAVLQLGLSGSPQEGRQLQMVEAMAMVVWQPQVVEMMVAKLP